MRKDTGKTLYSEEASGDRNATPPRESRTLRHVPASIKSNPPGGSKVPALTLVELMAAHEPPLQYTQVKLGLNGSCLDFFMFWSM
jgi:hypothetical protein